MRTLTRSTEHVGEWKLALWADSLEELFAAAARAASRQCGPVGQDTCPWQTVSVESRDRESLLADWLNELLGLSEILGCALAEIRGLRIEGASLRAEVRGRRVRCWRSSLKAATYHGLLVSEKGGRWKGVVVFDI